MTDNKFLKLAVIAMVASLAFTAKVASAGGLSCDDWSFDDSSCPAYIAPSGRMAESTTPATVGMQCSDWSFDDPSCPAFSSATAAGGMEPVSTGGAEEGAKCSDWSFYDKGCSAYIQ